MGAGIRKGAKNPNVKLGSYVGTSYGGTAHWLELGAVPLRSMSPRHRPLAPPRGGAYQAIKNINFR